MKALRGIAWSVAALLLLLAFAAAWLLRTESGARFAADLAQRTLAGKLSTGAVDGTIAGGLRITDLRWRDAAAGIEVRAGEVRATLAPGALLGGTLRLRVLALREVLVDLTTVAASPGSDPAPLTPPIDIVLDAFTLESGELRRDGTTSLVIARVAFAGEWTHSALDLRSAHLVAPDGEVSLEARFALREPSLEHATGTFDWRAGGRRWRGSLASVRESDGVALRGGLASPFPLALTGAVSRDGKRPWHLHVAVPRFDPRRELLPDSELEALAAELDLHGANDQVNVSGSIDIDDERLAIRELTMQVSAEEIAISELRIGVAEAAGEVRGSARVRLAAPDSGLLAHLHWDSLELPARWVGEPITTSGQLFVDGNLRHFETRGALDIARERLRSSVAWKADGSRRKIHLREGRVSQAHGLLTIAGELGLEEAVSWRLTAAARGFDPAGLVSAWPGALDFELDTHGELAPAGPSAQFVLRDLHGQLRGHPLTGGGRLTLAPEMHLGGQLHLASGATVLDISGAQGDNEGGSARLTAKLHIASLADWNPRLQGRARLTVKATGRWPDTAFHAAGNAQDLQLGTNSVNSATLELDLRTPRAPRIELTIRARDAMLSGMQFATLAVTGSGTEAAHEVSLHGDGHPLAIDVRARGGYVAPRWSGTLDTLKLDLDDAPPLALESAAQLVFAPDAFEVGQSCLSGGDIRLCASGSGRPDGQFVASYSLRALPLALLAQLLQPGHDLSFTGHVDGEGRVARERDGSLSGEATLTSASGSVEQSGQDSPLRLEYRALDLGAVFAHDTARAHVAATLTPDGQVAGEASLSNLLGDEPALRGQFTVALRDLAPIEWIFPQLADVAGNGDMSATLGGTLRAPSVAAQLMVREFQADVPALGIRLQDGEFNGRIADDGSIDAHARVTSGGGSVELSGSSPSLQQLDLDIRGENFLAANFPAAHLTISPDLTLTGSPKALALGGAITIPRAAIDLDKLTNTGGARISPDVVVVDRPERQSRRQLALRTDVRVILGRNVSLVGLGLDATVDGQLRVVELPGMPSTGSGEIRLAGTYEAFGRKLSIERGQMLFANSPLDNPQLDLLAARKLSDITAKVRVTGSARRPQLDVFTEPATSPTEAMSYLLTGKSLSDLRGTEGERVEAAAQSLGGVLGDRVARRFAGKLGIDTVGVEQNEDLGSAFTVGRYLSPGFFVSYGVGLFEPGTIITLRYEISERWSLEATDSPNEQRGGVHFRIER